MKRFLKYTGFLSFILLLSLDSDIFAQREYIIMDRGMLRESVYNNGILSSQYFPKGRDQVDHPAMEWPKYSNTIIEDKLYDGQHNSLGGGMTVSANFPGRPTQENREFAYCGLANVGDLPMVTVGKWNFPIQFQKEENYPLLRDGQLNPNYNPNEAELKVFAQWATSVGITVTRISRQWSYPDYDDFILHEYQLEFTGNTDSNPLTIEIDSVNTLKDVIVTFANSFAPNLLAYQRTWGTWANVIQDGNYACIDHKLWLAFNLDTQTDGDANRLAKAEPKPDLFQQWAETGENGGGLLAPQAAGICVLYYDKVHLAKINTAQDTTQFLGEAEYGYLATPIELELVEINQDGDSLFTVKQPWQFNQGKFAFEPVKNRDKGWIGMAEQRKFGYWTEEDLEMYPGIGEWLGRGVFPTRHKLDRANIRMIEFGPYTLKKGEVIEFSFAQVVGYWADSRPVMGGGQRDPDVLFATPTSLDSFDVVLKDENGNDLVMTSHYLSDYGYPDYVNSDVITVQQVTRKAIEMYTGAGLAPVSEWAETEFRYWPDKNPKDGVHSISNIPWPSPMIDVVNTPNKGVKIRWTRAVENFQYATGHLEKFNIYRAYSAMGPWKLLNAVSVGVVTSEDVYEYIDDDPGFKIGSSAFYAVTSVNDLGLESARCNIFPDPDKSAFTKSIGAVDKMGKVYVVPNPFVVKSGFDGVGEEDMIGFYGLPAECTIRIYSYSGQLIKTLHHNDPVNNHQFFQVTRNQQKLASGLYFYVVKTPDGEQTGGKFMVVK